jgi:hypothetical protein
MGIIKEVNWLMELCSELSIEESERPVRHCAHE